MPGIMNIFTFVCIAVVLAVASEATDDSCYKDVLAACNSNQIVSNTIKCNATYGSIMSMQGDLQSYANDFIQRSFDYLLISSHFKNYEKSRDGFEKYFKSLSDEKWESAKNIIKYLTMRGGEMDFTMRRNDENDDTNKQYDAKYELYELESLANALDWEKGLAVSAFHIHREATRRVESNHDPSISHYIEEKFVEKQAEPIRKLTGYITDLRSILASNDFSLGLHFFDDYLAKSI